MLNVFGGFCFYVKPCCNTTKTYGIYLLFNSLTKYGVDRGWIRGVEVVYAGGYMAILWNKSNILLCCVYIYECCYILCSKTKSSRANNHTEKVQNSNKHSQSVCTLKRFWICFCYSTLETQLYNIHMRYITTTLKCFFFFENIKANTFLKEISTKIIIISDNIMFSWFSQKNFCAANFILFW